MRLNSAFLHAEEISNLMDGHASRYQFRDGELLIAEPAQDLAHICLDSGRLFALGTQHATKKLASKGQCQAQNRRAERVSAVSDSG
jgi:hypothetical protein